jgi:hypothetical protein
MEGEATAPKGPLLDREEAQSRIFFCLGVYYIPLIWLFHRKHM